MAPDKLKRRRRGVQVALLAGFAVVFALWLFWGYQLLRSLEQIEANVAQVQDSYDRGEQALLGIRTNVLLGSIFLRDALIDNGAPRRDYYRDELIRLRDEVDTLLASYVRDSTDEERAHWQRLQQALADYWTSRDDALREDVHSPAGNALLLLNRVVPKRQVVLEIVDELGELQRGATARQRQTTNALHDAVRQRMIGLGTATMIVAFGVALVASRHVNRLQRQVEYQRIAEQDVRQDLERLSARLVDAQETERREISRELHDAIGQALTAVKMDIGVALRGSELNDRTRHALEEAKDVTESTLQSVRDLSQLLHPSMLDDFGLPETLRAYLKRFAERTGMRATLDAATAPRMPAQIEACLYRIAQEAMNNIARHSGATATAVALTVRNHTVTLSVEDDGRGLTPAPGTTTGHGLGLIAMRERAQAMGGTFSIGPRPAGGTVVRVTIPLPAAAPEPADLSQAG